MSKVKVYNSNKSYGEMTRAEKRKYKRWMAKNNMWDGEEIAERIEKTKRLVLIKALRG